MRACALRTAQLLNKAELSRDVGISGSTAGHWLSVLEASGLAMLLEPWFSNRTKSLVKTPKLYMGDTGLAAFLMGIQRVTDIYTSPLAGALWETMVAAELRRRQTHRDGGWDFHFWRDRTKEADFLFHQGGTFALGEAKWTEHPSQRDADGLLRIAAELPGAQARYCAIICRCANSYPLTSGVQAIPLSGLDELLGGAGGI